MDKKAIRTYSIWARNKLIRDIKHQAALVGIDENGIKEPLPQSTTDLQFYDIGSTTPARISGIQIQQRNSLVREIQSRTINDDYTTAYNDVVEEVAYTWFNRLIAIRFMEVNNYLPSGLRVLSSTSKGKTEPDIVTTPMETGFNYTNNEIEKISRLKDSNQDDELFRFLFLKQCHELNSYLPDLFEEVDNVSELLLTISFKDSDGVVYKLVYDIPEEDFDVSKGGQIEIIGWLYQYYNTEVKEETNKSNDKINKQTLPSVTQLFTPEWIVKYMVENSVGKIWIEGHPNISLRSNWSYYLDNNQTEKVETKVNKIREEYRNLKPEDITIIDPSMGSGHILVYAFEVLLQIYESEGYNQRTATKLIVEKNLYGLDIDKRAFQLAYFSVMMKARQYDRRALSRGYKLNLYPIEESNAVNRNHLKFLGTRLTSSEKERANEKMNSLLDKFYDAKLYGSILVIEEEYDYELLHQFIGNMNDVMNLSLETVGIEDTIEKLRSIVKVAELLTNKYYVACTNPPYLGTGEMQEKLKKYLSKNYNKFQNDLYASFIALCIKLTVDNGVTSMITMRSFMFIPRYESARKHLLRKYDFLNLVHLGPGAFEDISGEFVQTAAFTILNNKLNDYMTKYIDLNKYNSPSLKEKEFFENNNQIVFDNNNFKFLPGSPMSFKLEENIINIFSENKLAVEYVTPRVGLVTGDKDRFQRLWYEVSLDKFRIPSNDLSEANDYKWVPYQKGGEVRKWYGNNWYVVNWENNGYEMNHDNFAENGRVKSHNYNGDYAFKKAITWSKISTGLIPFRFVPNGFMFDDAGPLMSVNNEENILGILALYNSVVGSYLLTFVNHTQNVLPGQIKSIPISEQIFNNSYVNSLVKENIDISEFDWDTFEISWHFKRHPLININKYRKECLALINSEDNLKADSITENSIEKQYESFKEVVNNNFKKLKSNEENLNKFFIDIYGLEKKLTAAVESKDITIASIYDSKKDIPNSMKGNTYVLLKKDIIKQFINYVVGNMFGRYSLDKEGVINNGKSLDNSNYKTYQPVQDNVVLITDEDYQIENIVNKFIDFIRTVYGEEALDNNLTFITDSLGLKGNTNENKLYTYFNDNFFNDHKDLYRLRGAGRRPIYWLFNSGKQNGFKALIYMHHWNKDTIGHVRNNYLHPLQKRYDNLIKQLEQQILHTPDVRDKTQLEKRRDKLVKQLQETRDYDKKLLHLANEGITIDLDDGFKINHEKVQTDREGNKYDILAKV